MEADVALGGNRNELLEASATTGRRTSQIRGNFGSKLEGR
jgi:hypothetical protein